MALFGSDRPVMPSFKTSPDPDSSARSPYDDLNRLERNLDRNNDRNPERQDDRKSERRDDRNPERSLSRQLDRPDERNEADVRTQERLERIVEQNGREQNGREQNGREQNGREQNSRDRNGRDLDREPIPLGAAAAKASQPILRKSDDGTDPLIQGLFSKLPEPETEWPLAARQKWLQTAANIFDLMYAPNQADAGELAIRVERTAAR
jgi:hypothetical protein